MWIELDELYERRSILREKITDYFDGDDNPNYGEMNYQRLMEELEEVDTEIRETFEKG